MYVELYENEYQYIINCIEELLPGYYKEITKSFIKTPFDTISIN